MGYQDTFGDRLLKFLGWRETFYTGGRRREFVNIVGTNSDGTENPEDLYLRRYYLYRGKHRPHVYLHHIIRSDYDRACHDHPWSFVSVILKGGYTEIEQCRETAFYDEHFTERRCKPGRVIFHRATDLHRLKLDKPAWSLVFTGRRQRDWGFQTPDKGWIKWNTLYQYIKDMME